MRAAGLLALYHNNEAAQRMRCSCCLPACPGMRYRTINSIYYIRDSILYIAPRHAHIAWSASAPRVITIKHHTYNNCNKLRDCGYYVVLSSNDLDGCSSAAGATTVCIWWETDSFGGHSARRPRTVAQPDPASRTRSVLLAVSCRGGRGHAAGPLWLHIPRAPCRWGLRAQHQIEHGPAR
jgi:hypothetical protein